MFSDFFERTQRKAGGVEIAESRGPSAAANDFGSQLSSNRNVSELGLQRHEKESSASVSGTWFSRKVDLVLDVGFNQMRKTGQLEANIFFLA